MPPALDADVVVATLRAALAPAPSPYAGLEVHERLDSTNAHVTRHPVPWQVVTAEVQGAGRGRLGRSWVTAPGESLAVSVLLPPVPDVGWVPLAVGLAVARAVDDVAGPATVLKWPNDVLVPADGDRKLAGILCELLDTGVVVGAGVNVGQGEADLPVDTATSLAAAGAPDISREALLAAYLRHLADLHTRLAGGPVERAGVRTAYRDRCATIGAHVEVHRPGGDVVHGVATGVDDTGRLVLRASGGTSAVAAGDVVHVRPGEGGRP